MCDQVQPYCKLVNKYRDADEEAYFVQKVIWMDWSEYGTTVRDMWKKYIPSCIYLTPSFREVFHFG